MILDFPTDLPRPRKERWQPLRGGLLNLYRYDHEIFQYEDGRLLLRGNNGTGKSRVLALQLPFLLDGEIAPARLEPDGDLAKRLEWNLLMGKYPDRLGYTWLEFGRRDGSGEHYLTIGCGLHAMEGRGAPTRWYFVTSQRVGKDLFLQSRSGSALRREALVEALGAAGHVYRTATEYRAAVDRELFRLGPERYEALMGLLIQLRQPQLSRNLDEKRLSEALRDALPRASSLLLDEVADAFRNLDDDRTTLAHFTAASAGAEAFLAEYRRYAQIAARRRSEELRVAHSRYEGTMGSLRQALAELEAARTRVAECSRRIAELEIAEGAAGSRLRTLRESPEMRQVEQLDGARRLAQERLDAAVRAAQDRQRADAALVRAEKEVADALRREEEARAQRDTAAASAGEAAREVGLGRSWERVAPEEPRSQRAVEADLQRKREAAATLKGLVAEADAARVALEKERDRLKDLQGQLEIRQEEHAEAHDRAEAALEALVAGYRTWASGLTELQLEDPEALTDLLRSWEEGDSPVAPLVRRAQEEALGGLAAAEASARTRRNETRESRERLLGEREDLLSGRHAPPPAPSTRSERAERPGAPLWRLCDFAPGLGDADRAGLEAALEAAGLLDAWVTPGGELLPNGVHDTVLALGRSPRASRHLGTVLVPCVDAASGVSEATVAAILELVGLGEGPVWVDCDGRWGAGPLHGSWTKPAAQHLGEAAREARRQERLREIAAELERVEAELAGLDEELRGIARRQARVRDEAGGAPSDTGVRDARARLGAALRELHRVRQQVSAAEGRVAEGRTALAEAEAERDRMADDLGLSRWVGNLPGLERALQECGHALRQLWSHVKHHVQLREAAAVAAGRRDAAGEEAARRETLASSAEKASAEAAGALEVLESSVGATAGEILVRVALAEADEARVRADLKVEEKALRTAEAAVVRAETKAQGDERSLEDAEARRDEAVRGLSAFAATRLLGVALPALAGEDPSAWSTTRAVEVARKAESSLAGVAHDEGPWGRSQREIHGHFTRLQDALLPHDFRPEGTMDAGVFVVSVPFQGRSCTLAELRDVLMAEVESRQSLLSHKERELLENHLIGEVAAHLHERLRGAERLVREMNGELQQRPTSTGMALRFDWSPLEDGPPGLPEARKVLMRSDSTWSAADRQALGQFLQARIADERARREDGSWKDHLEGALDYRAWHRFSVERQQDGQWKRLTRRTHGTGSGGEKAIALTIPQFAAAAAHYRTADPRAPRLILLDEAFVGIDKDMRGKCMELMQVFDLDFVMTSEHEWGCYAALPGVAIYQLSSRPGIDAVGVTRWVWNGRERVRADAAECPAAVPV